MPTGGPESSAGHGSADLADGGDRPVAIIVSDAGPLIALGRLDLIGVLGALFSQVLVPDEVVRECLARPGNPDTARIHQALAQGQLVACSVAQPMLAGLGAGESAAIGHARVIGAAVLIDELAGRQRALAMGLRVTGTLGVLVRARKRGLIGPVGPLVASLRASGQRLSQALVLQALAALDEAPP